MSFDFKRFLPCLEKIYFKYFVNKNARFWVIKTYSSKIASENAASTQNEYYQIIKIILLKDSKRQFSSLHFRKKRKGKLNFKLFAFYIYSAIEDVKIFRQI